MSKLYHIKLWSEKFTGEFDVYDKEITMDTFVERGILIINKPNGEQFAYDMSKFMGIEITKNKEKKI